MVCTSYLIRRFLDYTVIAPILTPRDSAHPPAPCTQTVHTHFTTICANNLRSCVLNFRGNACTIWSARFKVNALSCNEYNNNNNNNIGNYCFVLRQNLSIVVLREDEYNWQLQYKTIIVIVISHSIPGSLARFYYYFTTSCICVCTRQGKQPVVKCSAQLLWLGHHHFWKSHKDQGKEFSVYIFGYICKLFAIQIVRCRKYHHNSSSSGFQVFTLVYFWLWWTCIPNMGILCNNGSGNLLLWRWKEWWSHVCLFSASTWQSTTFNGIYVTDNACHWDIQVSSADTPIFMTLINCSFITHWEW